MKLTLFFSALFLGWLLGLATPPFYKWIVARVTKKTPVDTLKILLALPVIAFLLQSCGHFPDGTSIWAEGGWLVPAIPFAGSVIYFVIAYRKSKSGFKQQLPTGTITGDKNVPIYKIPEFFFIEKRPSTLTYE